MNFRAVAFVFCMHSVLCGGLFAAPADTAPPGSGDAARESMKDFPWFDYPRDTYHRYRPSEVPIPEREKSDPSPRRPGVPGAALNSILYAVAAAVVLILAYLLYRIYEERRKNPLPVEIFDESSVEHALVSADLAAQAGINEPLSLRRLRELVEQALAEPPDLRAAHIYMFLFITLSLGARGWIELRRDRTAREYARELEERERAGGEDDPASRALRAQLIPIYTQLARAFEFALYGEGVPPEASLEESRSLWTRLREAVRQ